MTKNKSCESYYDKVFQRIIEMEKKQFEEENNKNWNNYLKNYKFSEKTFNIFDTYNCEISKDIIKS
jgi:hypothetical protein